MAFVIIRLIYLGFIVCRTKRKKCRGSNGVGYCSFIVLGRDIIVVS